MTRLTLILLFGLVCFIAEAKAACSQFSCDHGTRCIPNSRKCDLNMDCNDGSDEDIDECQPIPPALQPLDPYETDYGETTTFHWAELYDGALKEGGCEKVDGPFGFGIATKIDGVKEQCLLRENFDSDDECMKSYTKEACKNGFSFGIFEKKTIDAELMDDSVEREYVISTGGDETHPGFAIYHQGHFLHAIVNVGGKVWEILTLGLLKADHWNNIAIRWQDPQDSEDAKGLELFINMELKAYSIYPTDATELHDPLEPQVVMIGCQQTTNNPTLRGFGTGEYDELAMWDERVRDNETLKFLGGYKEELANVTAADLAEALNAVDLSDSTLNAMAVKVLSQMTTETVSGGTSSSGSDKATASPTSITDGGSAAPTMSQEELKEEQKRIEEAKAANLEDMVKLIEMMTQPDSIKVTSTPEDVKARLGLIDAMSNLMSDGRKDVFEKITASSRKKPGAAGMVGQFEDWLFQLTDSVPVEENDEPFHVTKTSPNIVTELQKGTADYFMNKYNGTFRIPAATYTEWDEAVSSWKTPPSSFEVPLDMFTGCDGQPLVISATTYGTYDALASNRINSLYSKSKHNEIDSGITSIRVEPSKHASNSCKVNDDILFDNPMKSRFEHRNFEAAQYKERGRHLLGLFIKEEVIEYNIRIRHCVYWNEEISDYGVWDMKYCRVIETDETNTRCSCTTQGSKATTFGILAETIYRGKPPDEQTWLLIVKYVCYGISIICLLVFIITILLSKMLKEMFHLMGMQMAAAFLLGVTAMLLTDIDAIRKDNTLCGVMASLMQVFFTATAAWLLMLSWAAFKAITKGIITGKLAAYSFLSWGLPLVFLGLAYYVGHGDYGNDPVCMISRVYSTKDTFFLPVVSFSAVGSLLALIVMCNLSTSAMKKESHMEELRPVCAGLVFVVLWFTITWSIAIPAYYHLNTELSFYPLFQILNSMLGSVIFIFLGLFSPRFRMVIMGQANKRSKWLVFAAMGHTIDLDQVDDIPDPAEALINQNSESEEEDEVIAPKKKRIYMA